MSLGGGIPAGTEADPPVNRITDTSKNITLATISLQPVIIKCTSRFRYFGVLKVGKGLDIFFVQGAKL